MISFERGETVVCSLQCLRTDTGLAYDPATSIVITVKGPKHTVLTNGVAMSRDGVGLYHYDFQTAAQDLGNYQVLYTAADGTRISKQRDSFSVHE